MELVSDVDFAMAMPSSIGVHSTIALAGTYSPANPPTANDPGLNATNVFVDTPTQSKGKTMLTKHWILIGVALLAIWYFFFRGGSASLSAVAA